MKPTIANLAKAFLEAEAIVVGAGSGLSASAGFDYGGENFLRRFAYMAERYGARNMYEAGFAPFGSLEEYWGFWAEYIHLNRYATGALPLYEELFALLKGKDYFVITTNVDHQFQKAGFDKKRLFYMQGDYGLFQCSKPCRPLTFDNEAMVERMRADTGPDHEIPSSDIPHCPYCGAPMVPNLRSDDLFVEDEGWHAAKARYDAFLARHENGKVLYLELGVGYMTPVWIKYPFMRRTFQNADAIYASLDLGEDGAPREIQRQSLHFQGDIQATIEALIQEIKASE